jgi:hypothetical protein
MPPLTNQEAIVLLTELVERAEVAIKTAVWAEAFLSFGGEATWDAIKSVSDAADAIRSPASAVATFRDRYEEIAP